ncbi:alpha/beta fold hydrolase [Solirubrobacter ginsenosidimutans]|uniref:Alpha/beta fold hydrolase n=1 Tax=Solirubrobacter ginsenosidimutans TaxID=490573 RepID=A0A9X3MNJ0_9ACTN|nr:alpha/beta fold hydrolase [Solirubrobacter ginsenosidimutans]MDA0159462.1 alpha/beta fold hydrolase [Solirubrobacter ginsenosidimutans]
MTQAQVEARALSRLAAQELSELPRGIGDIHGAIADRVFGALGPSAAPVRVMHRAVTRGVYESVRGGLWLGAHAAGAAARTRVGETPLSDTPRGAMALAALNGLYGDRLAAEGSPLAIPMQARRIGATVTPHLVVFLHGLGETEYAWGSPNYGDLLADATPVFIRFNTGRHISDNGAALAALLDDLVAEWPVEVERITIIGHSMGGLIARSACHRGGAWTAHVRHVISLGTPHLGAPLEQAVHAMSAALHLAPETRPFSRFLRRRSAGIRDLRRGSLVDEDWRGQDPDALRAKALSEVPLLDGATHCFVAATVTRSEAHPVGRLVGDLLVLSGSASGRSRLTFDDGLTLGGTHHLALLNHPAVAEQLRMWLG